MALRDVVDITLHTLIYYLSAQTNIPSGEFWLQFPNDDFVNERTKKNENFPFVGIWENGPTKTEYFNYGCTSVGAQNPDGSFKVYSPLGRKKMLIQIDLFCSSQSQRRQYRNIIEHSLLLAKSLPTSGDTLAEYIDIEYLESDLTEDKPYVASFVIMVTGSVFREEDAYLIDQINVNSRIGFELTVTNTSGGTSGWLEITTGGVFVSGDPGY